MYIVITHMFTATFLSVYSFFCLCYIWQHFDKTNVVDDDLHWNSQITHLYFRNSNFTGGQGRSSVRH